MRILNPWYHNPISVPKKLWVYVSPFRRYGRKTILLLHTDNRHVRSDNGKAVHGITLKMRVMYQ